MFRSREAAVIQVGVAILSPVAISLPALFASTSGPNTMSSGTRIFFILLGVLGFGVGLRCALSAIHVEPGGVRVVNPFSSRRIAWADIERFTLDRWGLLPRNCVILLEDGSRQGVWAISARNPNFFRRDRAAEGLVTQLNERLHSERG